MAQYLLRNSLNPGKVVACSVTFRQMVNKGEEGEPVWLVEVVTVEPHKDGIGAIPPVYEHYTSDLNLDRVIQTATAKVAEQVDWSPLTEDLRPPFVYYSEPASSVAEMHENVLVDIKDILPAAGIDHNSIEVVINDIDVTGDIELLGDPYEYRIMWSPPLRVYDYE
jgi:hypothetical protein